MAKITSSNLNTALATNISSANTTAAAAFAQANTASSLATAAFAQANTATSTAAAITTLSITSVQIANSSYDVLDDTAANTSGTSYLVVNGSGFNSNCIVIVGTTNATSTAFANTKQLRAAVTAQNAASYPVYVVDNVTGATAIRVNGVTFSSFPAWSTGSSLSNQEANTAFGVNLSASADSNITYSNTSALPAGTTLAANGLFSGTVTIGVETTYSFDVKATDAENQDATRTFSLTVTVIPLGGTFWASGLHQYTGLNSSSLSVSSPVQVGTDSNWSYMGNGFALKGDNTLWTWGQNNNGQLGQNNTNYRSSPTQVGTGSDWSVVGGGVWTTSAVKTNGTLWTWGSGAATGLNDNIARSSPTQVGTESDWATVFYGKGFGNSSQATIATKTNGTLWAWGYNGWGQLGLVNTIYRSSPVQVGTDTNWPTSQSKLTNSSLAFLAIKTNGTLWLWGDATYLINTVTKIYSSPVQVGAETNWSSISAGWNSVAAIKTNGTLWTWGHNGEGQLGHSSKTHISSPVQVGTSSNWASVRMGMQSTVGVKTDGTLWTWGRNPFGELGQNNTIYRSSPVQVGTGNTWRTDYGGASMGYALHVIKM